MKRTLTMIDGGRASKGAVYGTGPSYRYVVQGLPEGEEADIALFGRRWTILKTTNGVQGRWTGDYETADDALAALQEDNE